MPGEVEIVLVEHNPNDLGLALHALRREKLANSIEVAHDGEEALDYLLSRGRFARRDMNNQPRLVLLDLKLPKVGGMEVLRQLKSDPRTRRMPVVILTSSSEERDLVNRCQLGVNAYIQKPVDFDQFRQTVNQSGLFWLVVNQPPPEAELKAA